MKKEAAVIAALLLSSTSNHALAWARHGISSSCPYPTAAQDGCLNAPIKGPWTVHYSQFFTKACIAGEDGCARQSGQTYYSSRAPLVQSSHPPQWNVPGVDYEVGVPGDAHLQDVATASLPPGCVFHTATYTDINGNDFPPYTLVCTLPTTGDMVVDSVDFCAANGTYNGSSIALLADTVGTFRVTRSRFCYGQNLGAWVDTLGTSHNPTLSFIAVSGSGTFASPSAYNVDLSYDYFEMGGNTIDHVGTDGNDCIPAPGVKNHLGVGNCGYTLDAILYDNKYSGGWGRLSYSVVLHGQEKVVFDGGRFGGMQLDHNYMDGYDYDSNGVHGEYTNTGGYYNYQYINYSYNVITRPNVKVGGQAYMVDFGEGTSAALSGTIDHNVIIYNYNGGTTIGGQMVGEGIDMGSSSSPVTITNNYVDGTGALFCMSRPGSHTIFDTYSGNIYMPTGASLNSFAAWNACQGQ